MIVGTGTYHRDSVDRPRRVGRACVDSFSDGHALTGQARLAVASSSTSARSRRSAEADRHVQFEAACVNLPPATLVELAEEIPTVKAGSRRTPTWTRRADRRARRVSGSTPGDDNLSSRSSSSAEWAGSYLVRTSPDRQLKRWSALSRGRLDAALVRSTRGWGRCTSWTTWADPIPIKTAMASSARSGGPGSVEAMPNEPEGRRSAWSVRGGWRPPGLGRNRHSAADVVGRTVAPRRRPRSRPVPEEHTDVPCVLASEQAAHPRRREAYAGLLDLPRDSSPHHPARRAQARSGRT